MASPSSSPPSTSRKPTTWPTGSRSSTRAASSPRALPGDLKRQVPGSHVLLRFADTGQLDAAARVLAGSTRNDEDLTLRVPSDGGLKSLRALLGSLDESFARPRGFSVHTPDLDDVFLALTGHAHMEVNAQ